MKSIFLVFSISLILVLSNPLNCLCAGTSDTSAVSQTSIPSGSQTSTPSGSNSSTPSGSPSSTPSAASSSSREEEHKHSGGSANCSQKAICEVCGQEYGELDPDTHVTVEKSDERTHFEECTLCNKKLNREPHRGGTATPTKQAVCEVCGVSYGSVDQEHRVLEVPEAISNLIYNGKTQTGVPEGEGYILNNHTAINAGTYVATAILEEGNEWSDGTTETKEISWRIQRTGVAVHVMDCTLSYGQEDPEEFPVEYRGLIGDDKISYVITREEGTEVGTYKLSITGDSKQENYQVYFAPGKLTITPLELEAKISVRNKWFDGTTDADLTVELSGVYGDTLAIRGLTGHFEDGQVGAEKNVLLDTTKVQILLNDQPVEESDLKNYKITIPESVTGKIQGPYVGEYGEGSQKEENSEEESQAGASDSSREDVEESAAESSVETSGETSEASAEESPVESSEETSAVIGETSQEESAESSVETSGESSMETSQEESGSESKAETSEESSQNTQEVLRQLTSGDNWTLIWFVIFSLLGCFIAGIILAWKAEMEPKN